MNDTASDFRSMARNTLKGKWGTAVLLTVVASLLGAMTSASTLIKVEFKSESGMVLTVLEEFTFTILQNSGFTAILAIVALVWGILVLVIGGAMTLGYN